jgi:hypothetical protein
MGEYSKNTKRYHQYLFLTVRGKHSQCHRLKKDEQLLSIQEKKERKYDLKVDKHLAKICHLTNRARLKNFHSGYIYSKKHLIPGRYSWTK